MFEQPELQHVYEALSEHLDISQFCFIYNDTDLTVNIWDKKDIGEIERLIKVDCLADEDYKMIEPALEVVAKISDINIDWINRLLMYIKSKDLYGCTGAKEHTRDDRLCP